MKIPPKKPHFLKPIKPGFKNGLKIPIGFLKYLKGHDHIEHAILKRDGKKWHMKLKGHRFEGGWAEFVQQNDVQLGDILVFRHEGNMEFEVSMFDSTHCDREYAEYMQEEGAHTGEEISKIFKFKEMPRRKIKSSKMASSHVKAAIHHKSFGHSHFECTIREYCFLHRSLHLPQRFAYANGLTNKKCGLIIRDERQRSWNLKLSSSESRTYIGGGWTKFVADNCLRKGDRIMFDVVTNGETPIWKFQVTNRETPLQKFQERPRRKIKSSKKASSHVKAVIHHKSFGHSHFECTISEYCFSHRFLDLPQRFAYANGLTNKKCSLIIRDERQRSWNLKLSSSHSRTYIGGGWTKLVADNCLRKGDRILFEVITNGETPIWKFQVTNRETPLQKFQERPRRKIKSSKKASSHVKAVIHHKSFGHSHFECTISEYSFSHRYLDLPQRFVYANGLTNKKCSLIIRDERQRSWNLKLSSSHSRTYIGGGWTKLVADNCLRKGDRIMFEVITNGETPIWKFQVTNRETPLQKFQDATERPRRKIKSSKKASSHVKAAIHHKFFGHSHFECTIREYCFSHRSLDLPQRFAYANGLTNKKCGLIIRDERQRSWNLKLSSSHSRTYIGGGWTKFVADNCLRKGDRIMFEVVTNGETPIWKFQVTNRETPLQKFQVSKSLLNAQVVTSTSGDEHHPCFISTITPYCFTKPILYLPLDFAKSNGLMNRKCEMILKDEAQRCWSVWLGRAGLHFGITRGWTKFRAENGLQVGDVYKFELIKNGEIPIAQFHCKYIFWKGCKERGTMKQVDYLQ